MARRKTVKMLSEHEHRTMVAMGDITMSSPYISKKEKRKLINEIWERS